MTNLLQLRLGAEAGDSRAQVELAQNLLLGFPNAQQQREALHWVLTACEKGNADALRLHAALAATGLCRLQSFDDVHKLVTQAAALGDARARAQLALLGTEQFDAATWLAKPVATQHFSAPRIYTIQDFIPKPVCLWLIKQVRKRMQLAKTFIVATKLCGHKRSLQFLRAFSLYWIPTS